MNRLLLFLLVAELTSALPLSTDLVQHETYENITLFTSDPSKEDVVVDEDSDEEEEDEEEEDISNGNKAEEDISAEEKSIVKNDEKSEPPVLFVNHKSFACPLAKADLVTGTSADTISPEDIDIIAAMGDGLSTGIGLWAQLPLDFRGAVFSIGGDASIDGLVTIPNILREFNPSVSGASHGMGTREQLPEYQMNVARTGATSADLLIQSTELSRRLKLRKVDLAAHWVLISITIGSEEICATCAEPKADIIENSVEYLRANIPKALVVLIGPLNFWSRNVETAAFLRNRCPCFAQKTEHEISNLYKVWKTALLNVEQKFNDGATFGVVTAPFISLSHISLEAADELFLSSGVYFNRQGHNYAAKWLWNRLMTGSSNNISSSPLKDALVCPSMGCPYFRTIVNVKHCKTWKHSDTTTLKSVDVAVTTRITLPEKALKKRNSLYLIALSVVTIAFCVVFCVGTVLYNKSKHQIRGRFEVVSGDAEE